MSVRSSLLVLPPSHPPSPSPAPISSALPHRSPHPSPPHSIFSSPSGGWHTSSLSSSLPSSLLIPELPPYPMDGLPGGPTPVTPVIKAGWLDKNPPQG